MKDRFKDRNEALDYIQANFKFEPYVYSEGGRWEQSTTDPDTYSQTAILEDFESLDGMSIPATLTASFNPDSCEPHEVYCLDRNSGDFVGYWSEDVRKTSKHKAASLDL